MKQLKLTILLAVLMSMAGLKSWSTQTIIYSWESPDGTPIETGGTIAYVNGVDERVNYLNGDYYTICLSGKKGNLNDETPSANAGKMVITLDKALATGDEIVFTAFITKNKSVQSSPYIVFGNGSTLEGNAFGDEANINTLFNGTITTKISIVPEAAAGSKTITLTRSLSSTNLFITKLEIKRKIDESDESGNSDDPSNTNIVFADAAVKAICVANWDTDSDGELSMEEAAAVTNLGNAFESYSSITSFNELGYFTGLTSIGGSAFYGCSGLTSITIPNSVTSIGDYAFDGCSSLKKVIVNDIKAWCGISFRYVHPTNPLYYAHHLYSDENTEITNLVIPDGVTSIGNCAFEGCSNLISVRIPNSVTSIGKQAFSGCTGLTSIAIPESVTSIGGSAFYGCTGLTSITIPESVTSIEGSIFSETAWYNNQPDGLIYIGKVAYEYKGTMPDNTSITIKEGTKSIYNYAFSACFGLTSIVIPNSVTSIGNGAFEECSNLISVRIPNSVTSIGGSAFRGCSKLTSVTIPNSVTSIDDGTFSDCI